MKRYSKLGLAALLLTLTLALAACGGAGQGASQDAGTEDTSTGDKPTNAKEDTTQRAESTGGTSGMGDMDGMDHGSGGMASGMVMENGEYSDERFIDAMVPHHKGAVDMARVALRNAEHPEIGQLAGDIVSTQRAEIKELKSIKKEEFGNAGVPTNMDSEQMQMMGMSMEPQELAKQDPFDKAFIDNMIPHHQSAIEMAQIAQKESQNPRIKELADDIVSAQEEEISQMKTWREEWYPEG